MNDKRKTRLRMNNHSRQNIIPVSLCNIPIEGKVNHIKNTYDSSIKDGYYYDPNTKKYYHYITNPGWIT